MKYKWNAPQMVQIGVKNTYEDEWDLFAKEEHYCHQTGEVHLPSSCNPNTGHKPGGKCSDKTHNASNQSKCCCVEFLVES